MSAVTTSEAFAASESKIEFDVNPPPQKLFSMQGRIGVLKYFAQNFLWSTIFTLITFATVGFQPSDSEPTMGGGALILALVMLPYICIIICLAAKRLHDLNMSAWFLLLALVPVVNAFFGLYMGLMPGSAEDNSFGLPSQTKSWEKAVSLIFIFVILAALVLNLSGAGAG